MVSLDVPEESTADTERHRGYGCSLLLARVLLLKFYFPDASAALPDICQEGIGTWHCLFKAGFLEGRFVV